MDFVHVHVEKRREHRRVTARTDGAAFVIAEAEVRGEMALAGDGLDGAIENIHEALRVFAMRVAAHRRFIDGDFAAAGFDQRFEFGATMGSSASVSA